MNAGGKRNLYPTRSVGIQDTTFYIQMQVFSQQKCQIKRVPAYFRESAQMQRIFPAINAKVADENCPYIADIWEWGGAVRLYIPSGLCYDKQVRFAPAGGVCPAVQGRKIEERVEFHGTYRGGHSPQNFEKRAGRADFYHQ